MKIEVPVDDLDDDDGPPEGAPRMPLLPDPSFLWQVFRRNLWLFLACIVAVMLGAVAYLLTTTPEYTARASLLIEPAIDPVRTSGPNDNTTIANADEVDTELRLIGSPLVSEIAGQLYAERYASPDGDEYTPAEIETLGRRIRGSTAVVRSGSTKVIDITAKGEDSTFVAAAANLLAEAYLQSQVNDKLQRSAATQAFISERLGELERNSIDAQVQLDNYRAARGLVSANGGSNAEQEVSNLNQQLASAQAELAEKQGRLAAAREQLARGGGGADVGAALGSGTITSLRQQEARVGAQLAVLTERYGELHPERRQTQSELIEIQTRIQQEINRVISSLQAEVQTAQSRVSSLSGSREQALGSLTASSRAQAGLSELEQKANAARSIYQSFLARSQENVALRDSALPDASFAARASVPTTPSSPNYPLTLIMAMIGGFALGFASIFIAEYLRRGVQTKRDVERRLRLRYAGAIPTLRSTIQGRTPLEAPQEYVVNNPKSLFAESFRSIQTFLTLSPGKRPRAIAITSALPGEGKTTTSVCLGRATAMSGVKTVLIDADLRRRGSSELLDYESEYDIYDYLDGTADLDACIYIDPRTGLHLLGSNEGSDDSGNPLTEVKIRDMINELRSRYDVVVVDTAPILAIAEGRVIAAAVDRVLLVTQWKKTSVRAVEAVVDMLLEAGAKITGLALSQVNIKKFASTGDGDVYAYTKKFRGYYVN